MTRALNRRVSRTVTGDLLGIIYARASKDRKGRSISVASQVAQGRRFFKANNIVIVAVLVDNDLSASRYARQEREEYKEALRLIVTGEANLLWTWENSRATRELDAFVELRSILIKVGGYWAYDERIYDMDNPDDRIDTAEDAVDSEKESEKLRKRVRRGVAARAQEGEHHGPIWWGHLKLYDQKTGDVTIVPHPEQGGQAEELVTRLLSSQTETGIAARFERRGIPCPHGMVWTSVHVVKLYDLSRDPESWAKLTAGWMPEQLDAALEALLLLKQKESPSLIARRLNQSERPHCFPGKWSAAKVRAVALNPSLAGLRVHQGEIIGKGNWDGVITEAQHYLIVAKLGGPQRRRVKDGDRIKHLQGGILLCGICDKGTGAFQSGKISQYRCPDGHLARNKEKTDAYVVEAVLSRLERPDARELFRVQADAAVEVTKAMAEAKTLRARLDAFTDKGAEGELTPERLARIEAKLQPKIDAAEARARQIGIAPVVAEIIGPKARQTWARLDVAQQRDVLRAIVRPRLLKAGKGKAPFNPDAIQLTWLSHEPVVPELTDAG